MFSDKTKDSADCEFEKNYIVYSGSASKKSMEKCLAAVANLITLPRWCLATCA